MLAYIVAGIGVVIVLAGVAIAAVPGFIREFLADLEPKFIYAAVGARLLTGAFLVFASEACSWPEAVGTFGVIALAAGFIGLFMGIERINVLVSWFTALPDTGLRLISLASVPLGAFLVYAAV